ncbi:uncharacterized protein MAL13P1.304-like [Prorops nasuta]|uniref:uncharacterized protein MAL13P1.304-like n=1 Tax=Prorops nasuta TaxID=863751 RepID=UPI0034CE4789
MQLSNAFEENVPPKYIHSDSNNISHFMTPKFKTIHVNKILLLQKMILPINETIFNFMNQFLFKVKFRNIHTSIKRSQLYSKRSSQNNCNNGTKDFADQNYVSANKKDIVDIGEAVNPECEGIYVLSLIHISLNLINYLKLMYLLRIANYRNNQSSQNNCNNGTKDFADQSDVSANKKDIVDTGEAVNPDYEGIYVLSLIHISLNLINYLKLMYLLRIANYRNNQSSQNNCNNGAKDFADQNDVSANKKDIVDIGEAVNPECEVQSIQNNFNTYNEILVRQDANISNNKINSTNANKHKTIDYLSKSNTDADIWSAFDSICIENKNILYGNNKLIFTLNLNKENISEQLKSESHKIFNTKQIDISFDCANISNPLQTITEVLEFNKTNDNYDYLINTQNTRISSVLVSDVNLGNSKNYSFGDELLTQQVTFLSPPKDVNNNEFFQSFIIPCVPLNSFQDSNDDFFYIIEEIIKISLKLLTYYNNYTSQFSLLSPCNAVSLPYAVDGHRVKERKEYKNEREKRKINSQEVPISQDIYENVTENPSDSSYQPDSSDKDISEKDLAEVKGTKESTIPNKSKNSSINTTLDPSDSTLNAAGNRVPNDEYMIVSKIESGLKKDFCIYCKTQQTKLSRHLTRKHADVKEVKDLLLIPKGRPERKDLINNIRKQGQFFYNTSSQENKGELKVMRRPNKNLNKKAIDYAICPQCKGAYSKSALRYHYRVCNKNKSKNKRNVLIKSRQTTGRLHEVACDILRKRVFPTLRDDCITKVIRYDELCILFGNKLCDKYKDPHYYDMIRQKLRTIGRFLLEIKKRDNCINDLFEVLHPKYYKLCIDTIQYLAGINETKNGFKTPSLATNLGNLLKQVSKRAITVYILRDNKEKIDLTERFLKLIVEDYSSSIARVAVETQFQKRRQSKKQLPIRSDIQKLIRFLSNGMRKFYDILKEKFSFDAWKNLAEFTLISVQLFNRRRAGEIERAYVEDFNNYDSVNEKTIGDSFKKLTEEERVNALRYVRFNIRGKLGRTVPVLLSQETLKYIKILLKYRQAAKVHCKNPYLFGLPGTLKGDYRYLRAYFIIIRFSEECGASDPETLRGTNLRKHLATTCSSLNLRDDEVTDLAAFMGHAEKIHKQHYRQPILSKEILQISKILEVVHGDDKNDDENDDESDDDLVEPESGNNLDGLPRKRMRTNIHMDLSTNENTAMETSIENNTAQESGNSSIEDYSDAVDKTAKKKRSISPYGKCSRKRWSEREKEIAFREFAHHIKSKILPSFKEIQELKKKYPNIFIRNVAAIKTWINNQIRK